MGLLSFQQATAVDLECRFRRDYWPGIGHIYVCNTVDFALRSSADRVIAETSGEHKESLANADVKALVSMGQTIHYFPRNVEKIFPNINGFSFINVKLREIHQEDIKPYGRNLEYLILIGNEVQTLEKDLFQFNQNLKLIDFRHNRIQYVDQNVFDCLFNLKSLYMLENKCTCENAGFSREKVVAVIESIKETCSDREINPPQIENVLDVENSIHFSQDDEFVCIKIVISSKDSIATELLHYFQSERSKYIRESQQLKLEVAELKRKVECKNSIK